MRQLLTHDQLDELLRYAENDKLDVDPEAVDRLNQLAAAVQRNILRNYTGARKRNALLTERLAAKKENRNTELELGHFAQTGLDSAEIAAALLYQLQQLRTYRLTDYKVIAILYEMYASWLASKGERLCEEHPVCTEYGPRFWRALKRIDTRKKQDADAWRSLAEKNPGVAEFCRNAAKKYYDMSEKDLTSNFIKSEPYKNAMPVHNNGKWNKELNDVDIYRWKKKQTSK